MPPAADRVRKRKILAGLRYRTLDQAAADPGFRPLLDAEAGSDAPQKLVTRDLLAVADAARVVRPGGPGFAFFSSADVIIIPGFMGSELVDDGPVDPGLVWIDPWMATAGADRLLALRLKAGMSDEDAGAPGVVIRPRGAVPLIYGGLKYALEFSGYDVRIFGFDWRKHVDAAAAPLADLIRSRAGRQARPLHLVAHSQGSLVARRAVQMLGPDLARRLVDSLVLLGPATAGTFSAAFAIAGNHAMIDTARRYGLRPPRDLTAVLQSMTGLYQLLPWRTDPVNGTAADAAIEWVRAHLPDARPADPKVRWFRDPPAWAAGVDADRLTTYFRWGRSIDAGFFNDRTTIILGDAETVAGVAFDRTGTLVATGTTPHGDGTMPDSLARVDGVARVFKAAGAEHMMLPATWAVVMAVRDVLADRHPKIKPLSFVLERLGVGPADEAATAGQKAGRDRKVAEARGALPFVDAPLSPAEFFGKGAPPAPLPAAGPGRGGPPPPVPPPAAPAAPTPTPGMAEVFPPRARRLRVFSFDPLFAGELENLGAEQVIIELPWEFADGGQLRPGPVGEYLEVIDFDASSRCFYPPIDLNHPHLLAQGGIPVCEGDPRFHQQMVYAVAMNTIRQFEVALGRAALWAPNLPRNAAGEVEFPEDHRPGDEYVGRLRVYPHAMRARNAYYSPAKKALLLGYFPADGADVGRNLPGGMIFSSLSYDIIAHETTHALLDGLHRYFTQPSNPDVFAFHEAFADLVALLQHFTHPEVLRHQVAKARGDLRRETALGVLAAQFGEATGQRAALREYLGRVKKTRKVVRDAAGRDQEVEEVVRDELGRPTWEPVLPDPAAVREVAESHRRGAILVAAVFRAFLNIYENRVEDLRRIATGGTGRLPDGDLHPALIDRMAGEAAKAARHLLRMCVRALDYLPPVDVTFGEYLRALITADYDLVRDDDLGYRVAVIAAFRDWGIYPDGVRSLSVDSLLWSAPDWDEYTKPGANGTGGQKALAGLQRFFADHPIDSWGVTTDRRAAYRRMNENCRAFHDWLADPANLPPGLARGLGLRLDPEPGKTPRGIRRNAAGRPSFQVHTFRPCRRIGPDGQELVDVVVEVVQRREAYLDDETQADLDDPTGGTPPAPPDFYFRGGCTLIIDPKAGVVRYSIRKSVGDAARLARERAYRQDGGLPGSYLAPPDGANPFAALHSDD
ncbi:MAG TPA: hypothetical protein VH092_38635 [Urbifossiella sp.]|nr:hypothetical protein [Urbifossiella sp.]